MPSIAIMTAHARFPWLRQIEGGGDSLEGWRFTIGSIEPDCALVVVYDEPEAAFETALPRERRMLIVSEPPGIKTYRDDYARQFGTVHGPALTSAKGIRQIISQPALPWFYGVGFEPSGLVAHETVDTLLAMPPPPKREAVSVILSRKSQLPKHRARLAFVELLQKRLGERLQVFGRGFRDIRDKAEAISPFAYHLVLENNDIAHFWTEKTADALLGWSLPIFSGCANLGEYFPADAFLPLDIGDPARAAEAVEGILESTPYQARLPAIAQARKRLLTIHNLFPLLAAYAQKEVLERGFAPEPAIIRPSAGLMPFSTVRSAARGMGRALKSALGGKGTGR